MSASPGPDTPRLCLLIEDQPATRDWMLGVLDSAFPNIEVATAGSLKAAQIWLDQHGDELWLAIIDLGLPDGSGIHIVRRLQADHPGAMPIVATIYDDDAHLFEAIAAGARGYVLKDEEAELLVSYLQRIERGEPPLSPSIALRMLSHFRAPQNMPDDDAGLSPRETEVLALLAKGLTVAETARRLALQPQTVASYVKVIYQKLCISSRAEATREAIRRGLA
ncbi:LuxR C-terminal-related transcriptional regulator [Devosia faecipullorum]|uniref:LuxR C-terminal-related transcriptional regulator n=1 Tax=Devosia faecipullorum TaxID=2755039 RepID=UPI00187B52D2|nr:response regulator transcription factor [Devosia faecipullorum]MBE7732547.1 response regulator transcription factor [Devosia faecipullorum]